MNDQISAANGRLLDVLARHRPLVVAVSGGIDSLTLAAIAHRHDPATLMVHARSPAVPAEATARVRELAGREGWNLREIEAGEFEDPEYLANPYNRCYFCKTNLYRSIRCITEGKIASGANLDDLSDYRPGLVAASENGVVHPFVEAQISKAMIRELARGHQLKAYADLPAQPCLASRVETGVPIRPRDMFFIDRLEAALRRILGELATIRVRVRLSGVFVELGEIPAEAARDDVCAKARSVCAEAGYHFMGVKDYQQGSAFVNRAAV